MTTDQETDSVAARLTRDFQGKRLPPGLGERVRAGLNRINKLEASGGNYAMIDSVAHWLEWIRDLPWYEQSQDTVSLEQARKVLDEGHYGMEKVKSKVLDFISVQKLTKGNAQGLVICFVGPPGTGKTTITRIIAEALGRKFQRISLAALGDMSQLRGKSRFQPDAEPSLLIKAVHKARTKNPVICLDEIDKVGGQGLLGGEAMAAFLEILDPEQNATFYDHYVDFPFDLSKVLFVATANKLLGADSPVIDRIDMMTLPDYTREDKTIIAKKFIVPQKLQEAGLTQNDIKVTFEDEIWTKILDPYKWESGMRTLQHTVAEICFKIARQVVETGQKEYTISLDNLSDYILV